MFLRVNGREGKKLFSHFRTSLPIVTATPFYSKVEESVVRVTKNALALGVILSVKLGVSAAADLSLENKKMSSECGIKIRDTSLISRECESAILEKDIFLLGIGQ